MDRIQSQIEFYDKLAGTFDSQVDAHRISSEKSYTRLFRANAHYQTGLDIGCGTGNWTRGLLEVCDSVLAIDTSLRMLKQCRKKLGTARIIYQKVNVFDFPDLGKFDIIFSTFWISHVPFQLQDFFWQWVVKTLNPAGEIIMQDSIDSGPGGGGSVRVLPSGKKYEIVKNNYDFDILLSTIRKNGIDASITLLNDSLYLISGKRISS
jgi:SAM-dependent methyltransferase